MGDEDMEQKSLRVLDTNKTFISKITSTITKMLIPTRVGINSMMISMKRNNLIKGHNMVDLNELQKRIYKNKVEKKFNSGPGGCAVVKAFVIPAEIRGKVHRRAARKNTLTCERGAVAADRAEVIVFRVAEICPAVCIFHRSGTVISFFNKGHFFLRNVFSSLYEK